MSDSLHQSATLNRHERKPKLGPVDTSLSSHGMQETEKRAETDSDAGAASLGNDSRLMSESEITDLVQDALHRARAATNVSSPDNLSSRRIARSIGASSVFSDDDSFYSTVQRAQGSDTNAGADTDLNEAVGGTLDPILSRTMSGTSNISSDALFKDAKSQISHAKNAAKVAKAVNQRLADGSLRLGSADAALAADASAYESRNSPPVEDESKVMHIASPYERDFLPESKPNTPQEKLMPTGLAGLKNAFMKVIRTSNTEEIDVIDLTNVESFPSGDGPSPFEGAHAVDDSNSMSNHLSKANTNDVLDSILGPEYKDTANDAHLAPYHSNERGFQGSSPTRPPAPKQPFQKSSVLRVDMTGQLANITKESGESASSDESTSSDESASQADNGNQQSSPDYAHLVVSQLASVLSSKVTPSSKTDVTDESDYIAANSSHKSRGVRLKELKGATAKDSESPNQHPGQEIDKAKATWKQEDEDGKADADSRDSCAVRTVEPSNRFNRLLSFFHDGGDDESRNVQKSEREAAPSTSNTVESSAPQNPMTFFSGFFPPQAQLEGTPAGGEKEGEIKQDIFSPEGYSSGEDEAPKPSGRNIQEAAQRDEDETELKSPVEKVISEEDKAVEDEDVVSKASSKSLVKNAKSLDLSEIDETPVSIELLASERHDSMRTAKQAPSNSTDDGLPKKMQKSNSSPDLGAAEVSPISMTEDIELRVSQSIDAPQEELVPEEPLNRVQFKEQYPIPPMPSAARTPDEIMVDNEVVVPTCDFLIVDPKEDVKKLLNATMGPSIPRRFNACGVLKMLSMNKNNQQSMARADGMLDSLILAANTDLPDQEFEAAYGARTRALEIILNLCLPKDNRLIIFFHPDLLESIVNSALEDNGDCRMIACSILAMLAKSHFCREPMARMNNLLDMLAATLVVDVDDDTDSDIDENEGEAELEEAVIQDDHSVSDHSISDHSNFSDDQSRSSGENSTLADLSNISSASSDGGFSADDTKYTYDFSLNESVYSSATDDEASRSAASSTSSASDGEFSSSEDEFDNEEASMDEKKIREEREEILKKASINACAALLHISKQCAAAHVMGMNKTLLDALLVVSQEYENPIHTRCLEILCNLTRFPVNNESMATFPGLIPALLDITTNTMDEDRLWALRMLQNISSGATGKTMLANGIALDFLSSSIMRSQSEERGAAVATIYNLSIEPSCVVAMTNTKHVVTSLIHVAHDPVTPSEMRLAVCHSLAALGIWLQTMAGAGTVPEGVQETLLPTAKTTGWNRWE